MVTKAAGLQDIGYAKALSAGTTAAQRARRAVDMALQCLQGLEASDEVRGVIERGERLKLRIADWLVTPPTPEAREGVMRDAVSIQVEAVSLLCKSR